VVQVAQHLPSKCKTLSSNTNNTKKKKKGSRWSNSKKHLSAISTLLQSNTNGKTTTSSPSHKNRLSALNFPLSNLEVDLFSIQLKER
jgi:hypothetical protein